MNKYFDAFKKDLSFFFPKKTPVLHSELKEYKLSNEFVDLFPITADLLMRSTKTKIMFAGRVMILFSWEKGDEICSWICEFNRPKIDLIKEHEILINNMGGIVYTSKGPESIELNGIDYNYTLTMNQDFMYTGSKCTENLDWEQYYREKCERCNAAPIDLSNIVIFIREASGSECFYYKHNKEVIMFSHDHSFKFVKLIEGQPDLTMYKILGVKTFQDYVELASLQWREYLTL